MTFENVVHAAKVMIEIMLGLILAMVFCDQVGLM